MQLIWIGVFAIVWVTAFVLSALRLVEDLRIYACGTLLALAGAGWMFWSEHHEEDQRLRALRAAQCQTWRFDLKQFIESSRVSQTPSGYDDESVEWLMRGLGDCMDERIQCRAYDTVLRNPETLRAYAGILSQAYETRRDCDQFAIHQLELQAGIPKN
jgi:hypothetical protein